jgi:AraC-like DNA-binding protein
MGRVAKIHKLLTTSDPDKIEALCIWIAENSDTDIGWDQLSEQSGLSHKELIKQFQLYKQQTPMAFLRHVKEQKKTFLKPQSLVPLFLGNR